MSGQDSMDMKPSAISAPGGVGGGDEYEEIREQVGSLTHRCELPETRTRT
jgi:hypothetical protein